MTIELIIQPACATIARRCGENDDGQLDGYAMAVWREKTRRELGLAPDRPIIATGHQSLLWHPGILAKYLLVDALARKHALATANLIVVDQHAGDYGSFEVPIRRGDGSLGVRRLQLASVRKDEPMGLHEPFTPPPTPRHLPVATPHVQRGVERIHEVCDAHRNAPNAALQMGWALADLMSPWVGPMPHVTATDLVETSLSRALMTRMVDEPQRCAEAYNRAVAAVPDAGIGPLLIRDDYVELPLWRVRPDRRRMHAYDNDVENYLAQRLVDGATPTLLPRALFMTALMRLGMCDLFVHGTGGANYDRAMERWIGDWLGLTPAPIAVATATLRLDLARSGETPPDPGVELAAARRVWHDPVNAAAGRPSPTKRAMLQEVVDRPHGSSERRLAFFRMHQQLQELREANQEAIVAARDRAERARRLAAEAPVVNRRTWAFPLYANAAIDELDQAIRSQVEPCPAGA